MINQDVKKMQIVKSRNMPDFRKRIMYSLVIGGVAGFLNGLFGGGGGMIVVPLLMWMLKLESKVAHATAILIILPLSITSGLFYASFGNLDVSVLIPAGVGVVGGGIVGAFLLKKLSSKWVVIIFSIVMAVAGAKMLLF
ncbi:MAG: sulfite exporter TauE/SafE family protein [Clostridiales bacterium]|nr:sulfite exporter TauE/SafE family protein [Clostridiales bacterium]